MSEVLAFKPRISLPFHSDKDGIRRAHETQARLTFPDVATAVEFLNLGAGKGLPITVEGIVEQNETNTGPSNEYDAWVFPSREDGAEVDVLLRRYVFGDTLASAVLSEFIVETTQRMSVSDTSMPIV